MKSPLSRVIYPGASRSIGVEQVKSTLRAEEELIWRVTARNERIGLIIRPPSIGQSWIIFFYGNGMTVGGTAPTRQRLANAGYGVVCVAYLEQETSATLDRITLMGWSLGSAVAMDLASRRAVRAQILLSPLTSLFAAALDLAYLGQTAFPAGPFNALSRAKSVDCPTLIVSGSNDRLTRPWMADELTKAMAGRARQVNLSGVGHNDMLGTGARLWDAVTDFLKSTAGPATG
jgi:pimeloyl-ACP methyl ester carboxylesterase